MTKIRFACIIVTYRCNAKCHMCNTWKYPSKKEEVDLAIFEKLPQMDIVNVTGGEPFLRADIEDIIAILRKKCNRLVISSNGYWTDRILALFRKRQDIGIRISIEGLPKANDELRGIPDGFDRGIRTLIELSHMGVKDIGFGITVSDRNARDILELYHLAKMMKVEFATAAIHNSYYFHKYDNRFKYPEIAIEEFKKLIYEMLKSSRPKDWFRAYFNYGLISYIKGNPRLLPCEMGYESFFLDPYGEIRPCNVMEETMGNLRERSFDEIWNGSEAERIRDRVRNCKENCWMIGSVGEMMKKNVAIPVKWILKSKFLKQEY
ncbi:radical SAM protein [Candidatus Desantisbacteria bacterium CG_4_9_14_3_um_filter_40_11]|uniref:Radical SAM protein n=2 Tax=unclassified Candidatus Desantisiibacteriota TaxID=3106372 RepID=A0A2M7JED1_9BACT|nr:MAG: radical SAM protein [Candidatus Desantisbacteria bacterium CG_4_8_14_3_um_filter_40_12]PJB28885.1 MAG: radical SAM protein [Candidatus Desantisbacteria bacterium CG_4_9_14_3_um_filter_40_11]